MRQAAVLSFVLSTSVIVSAVSLLADCEPATTNDYIGGHTGQSQLRVEIPQANWVPIFFKQIDELVEIAKLPSLRANILPNDDLEARLWVAGGYFGMDGGVVRNTNGIWSGTYVHGFSKEPKFKK